MNQTLEVIKTRYSCRTFDGAPIPEQTLQEIAYAGLCAPSAKNRQPWRIITLSDKALIDELDANAMARMAISSPKDHQRLMDRGGTLFYNASAIMFIAKDPAGIAHYIDLDCGIVASHLTLAAASLGVDSVICGFARVLFDGETGEAMKQRLGFPPDFDFSVSVLLGFSDRPANPPHEPDPNKAITVS